MTAHCATCTCSVNEPIPHPSTSTPAGRAAARRIYETVKAEKEATR